MKMETAERQRKSYSIPELFFGNSLIVMWAIAGTLACALFVSYAALLYLGLTAFLIFYELGKHGCVTCYYCKTCTIGMGKLPEFFFKESGTANVNKRAQRLFPLIYLLLSALPIALVAISAVGGFSAYKIILLAAILLFSFYTGIVRRKILLRGA